MWLWSLESEKCHKRSLSFENLSVCNYTQRASRCSTQSFPLFCWDQLRLFPVQKYFKVFLEDSGPFPKRFQRVLGESNNNPPTQIQPGAQGRLHLPSTVLHWFLASQLCLDCLCISLSLTWASHYYFNGPKGAKTEAGGRAPALYLRVTICLDKGRAWI
jgi:hypothetical protein